MGMTSRLLPRAFHQAASRRQSCLEGGPLTLAASALALSLGCSGSSQEPRTANAQIVGVYHEDEAVESTGSLPRYFTVEVRSDGLWLDGQLVSALRVADVLADAAVDTRNRGAAVIFYTDGVSATAVLDQVARAGFTHVVVSGLSEDSFGDQAPTLEGAVSDESGSASDEAALAPSEESTPEDVTVKHYGLHIGGSSNSDEERARYLDPIGEHFDELMNCHLLANDRTVQASFGVDLLISAKGGRAKIQDYRTRLKGKDFQMCVLGVLGAIQFPAPERPTVVSYSVLFKPQR